MLKRKIAACAGAAALTSLCFGPYAIGQEPSSGGGIRGSGSFSASDPPAAASTVITVPPGTSVTVESRPGIVASAQPPRSYNLYTAARQPGSVPTPYANLPGSGHTDDEYYNKRNGGVPAQ